MKKDNNPQGISVEKKNDLFSSLFITLPAFFLLWGGMMGWCSIFDAFVFFLIIFYSMRGAKKGGIKELFSLFSIMLSLFIASKGHRTICKITQFTFFTNDTFLGRLGWFIFLLVLCWVVSHYFLFVHAEKIASQKISLKYINRFIGCILGGSKGLIIGYIFIVINMEMFVAKKIEVLDVHFQSSHSRKYVKYMEDKYPILKEFSVQ